MRQAAKVPGKSLVVFTECAAGMVRSCADNIANLRCCGAAVFFA
jgi:hypothetical protein